LLPKFEQFIREQQYLHNVSPATVSWHTHNLKWLPSEYPTEDELKAMVVRMREKGLRATGCNSAIRSINAYLKWAGLPLKIPQMREPQLVLPTYTSQQLGLLLNWKPKKVTGHRLHAYRFARGHGMPDRRRVESRVERRRLRKSPRPVTWEGAKRPTRAHVARTPQKALCISTAHRR
jgi:hypothetical protein